MIKEKVENRWEVVIANTKQEHSVVFNSIDNDSENVRVSLIEGSSIIVNVVDLIEALKRISALSQGQQF